MLFLISEQLISDREIVIWIWWGIFEAIFLRSNRSDRVGKSIFCSILRILVDPGQSRLIILLSVEYRSNRVQPDKSAYKTSTCFRLSRNHSSNLRYRHINEFNVVTYLIALRRPLFLINIRVMFPISKTNIRAHVYLISDSKYLSDSVSESRFDDAVSSHISLGKHDSLMVLISFILAEYDLAETQNKNLYDLHCRTAAVALYKYIFFKYYIINVIITPHANESRQTCNMFLDEKKKN